MFKPKDSREAKETIFLPKIATPEASLLLMF